MHLNVSFARLNSNNRARTPDRKSSPTGYLRLAATGMKRPHKTADELNPHFARRQST
jgi:hypothetical protein